MTSGSGAGPAYPRSALATAAGVGVLVALPVLNAHVLQPWVRDSVDGSRGVWWANSVVILAAHLSAIGLVGAALLRERLPWNAAGVDRPTSGHLVAGTAIVVAAVLLVAARQMGLYTSTYVDVFAPTNGAERAMFLANGIMVGGLQEPLWRAYAFRQLHLRANWSIPAAVLTTATSFGYYHGGVAEPAQVAFTFLVSIALSWVYLRSRTIWWPTLLHAGFNVAAGAFA